jgi:hypothetical protein
MLVAPLRARPDVLVAVPRGFAQLAQRLNGPNSLFAALRAATRDMVMVSQAVAVLAWAATVPELSRLLGTPEPLVSAVAAELCGRLGRVWRYAPARHRQRGPVAGACRPGHTAVPHPEDSLQRR